MTIIQQFGRTVRPIKLKHRPKKKTNTSCEKNCGSGIGCKNVQICEM